MSIRVLLSFLLFKITVFGQVQLQTGSAEYSIPIFEYNDNFSRLSTSISLNYSSGNGLKVSDIASNVGTGWAIQAGGFIVRQQVGEPDDQNSESIYPKATNCGTSIWNHGIALAAAEESEPGSIDYINSYFPNGFLYSEFNVGYDYQTYSNSECDVPRELALTPRFKSSMDKRWKQSRRALADREQDIFIFNFNGRVGRFVIGRDGSILIMPDNKLKITPVFGIIQNVRTTITGFTITDETGIKYVFNNSELSEISKIKMEPTSAGYTHTKSEPTGKYIISKWNLSYIENPFTTERMIFEYAEQTIWKENNYTSSYQKVDMENTDGAVGIYEDLSKTIAQRLTAIRFSNNNTNVRVDFNYYPFIRYDLIGDVPLSDIVISSNSNIIKKYHFEVAYFVKKQIKEASTITNNEKRFARLVLKSVQEIGKNNKRISPYLFEYFTGSETTDEKDMVPPQFTFAQDMWGYYNKSSFISIDDVIPDATVLENLHTNTNTYRSIGDAAAKLGLLKSIKLPQGGFLKYKYEQNTCYVNGVNKTVGGVRVYETTLSDEVAPDVVTKYSYTQQSSSNSSMWGYEDPSNIVTTTLRNYNDAPLTNYGSSGDEVKAVFGNLAFSISKSLINNQIKKVFGMSSYKPASTSKIIMTELQIFMLTQVLIPALQSLFDPYDDYDLHEYSFYATWSGNPVSMQYSRVKVETFNSGAGSVIYEFTSPSNQATDIPTLNFPYSSKQRFAEWEYGLPFKTNYYNSENALIKEVSYQYDIDVIKSNYQNEDFRSVKIVPKIIYNARCEYFTYTIPVTDFEYDFYYPIKGRAQIKSISEKVINPSDNTSITITTEYTYNPNNFLVATQKTTNSEQKTIEVRTYYPQDYNLTAIPVLGAMVDKNIINVPISNETWLIKPNGEKQILNASVTEFEKFWDYKPVKNYSLITDRPIPETGTGGIGQFNPDVLRRNTDLIKAVAEFTYDEDKNPASVFDLLGNRVNSTICDVAHHFPVAQIINASRDEVAYSSFEDGQYSYWGIVQGALSSGSAITGYKCVNGNFIVQTPTLTINKEYRLTFWTTAATVTVGSLSHSVKGPTVNGWTFYEYLIPSGYTASIQIAGNGSIDEVRLYPKNARMTTTNYDYMVGKNSECDENNRITYYEYDDMGRLLFIRDEHRDIVKMYEYNIKQ